MREKLAPVRITCDNNGVARRLEINGFNIDGVSRCEVEFDSGAMARVTAEFFTDNITVVTQ